MSYWDGSRWIDHARVVPKQDRRRNWAATVVMAVGLAALALPFQMTMAGHHSRYPGTLTATPATLHAGDNFTVSGCGYDRSLGGVVISFVGGSWGSTLDSSGCFAITGIPALSGDTLPAGAYEVRAYQQIGKKWTESGETTVTVVP